MNPKKQIKAKKLQFFSLIFFVLAILFFLIDRQTSSSEIPVDANGETHVQQENFIKTIAPYAQELQESYGVYASIIIGQAVLESNFGQSQLASKYNNLFGVKAYGDQNKVTLDTKEFVNEEWITIQGDFVVYDSWEASMLAHSKLFVNGVTWNGALYHKVLSAKDYQEAANEIQNAGYATDPDYAKKLIQVIKEYNLQKYD
ncbi:MULTISPECIES: glycoside hydrolase family 73 protein [unclassified Enterococcus]|uniref:glycoside hydrolase family 73 protein n=1 Tax=unclassified Enterococcus TaxID=2608891 RepID=UPI00155545DF|nr:glycoside hydrolase family 73 protein [Enterococcus sp. MMGLQ5-2]MBS7585008.1 glycoside hydrolase family 73 protein [Enterococcus sp. MMGLQ5-1]NPD12863.1 glycoside hydrolase family 73 protein [Enterococcus sp. MMGLQ5-1]NPD37326.1 glycoside hydrolase family 73 protein [Enterococcus sp. MMGLQ5-2]